MSAYADKINPSHYTNLPAGFGRECIDYLRELGNYSQAAAAKYVYRGGNKDPLAQELGKTRWYLTDAMSHAEDHPLGRISDELLGTIDPAASVRAALFYRIVTGDLEDALAVVGVLEGLSAPESVY